jgi:hypothetical protein
MTAISRANTESDGDMDGSIRRGRNLHRKYGHRLWIVSGDPELRGLLLR